MNEEQEEIMAPGLYEPELRKWSRSQDEGSLYLPEEREYLREFRRDKVREKLIFGLLAYIAASTFGAGLLLVVDVDQRSVLQLVSLAVVPVLPFMGAAVYDYFKSKDDTNR